MLSLSEIEKIFDARVALLDAGKSDQRRDDIIAIIDERLSRFRSIVTKDIFRDLQELEWERKKQERAGKVRQFKSVRRQQLSYSYRADLVIKRICDETGYTFEDLKSKGRKAHLAAARAKAMQEVHALGIMSFPAMGRLFERDHTTVMHAVGRCPKHIEFLLSQPHATKRDFERAEIN